MNNHPKIISTCCYVKSRGKILMLHRNKLDSYFNKRPYRGIGGKAEQGEDPTDCVIREVKEEAGIEINPIWKGLVTISSHGKNDWEVHIFEAKGFSGEVLNECSEGDLCWIDESELINLNMPEGDKKLTPYILQNSKFHAYLKYDENKDLVDWRIDRL